MKYLHSPEKQEQKGRVEDGPLGPKGKFREWPGLGNHIGHVTKTGKTAGTKGKVSAKTSSAKSAPVSKGVYSGGSKGGSGPKGK